ncbi:alpha/beta hydrolase [Herbiconiux sp. CPCC 205716]|uniref:Alpha/beta hydrolase n=1 Tax=Herbiconiux gentiana TaxID=2970912 RepID=A0ABT2GHP8_9MICO|nr:alpha/beta hydrolase [Herbiconiux gentiana]MCS5715753.1 alpha/beta hydrolase [Herbiconiux gentiana]
MSARLDPATAALLAEINQQPPSLALDSTPDELRAGFSELLRHLHPDTPSPFIGSVRADVVGSAQGGVPVRVYDPVGATGEDVVVYLHGGGWVLGGLDSAEPAASGLATAMGVRVISVDYRLSPEHPHPAAYDDALAVTRAVAATKPRWLGVAGDSAGGNLAAAVGLAAADRQVHVDAQLLFYPALDPSMRAPSHAEFADGFLLTGEAMAYYWDAYRGPSRSAGASFAPLDAPSVAGSPATVLATAGHDPLRDEGARFAERLADSGVPTVHLRSPSLVHGWVDQMDRVPEAAAAFRRAVGVFDGLRRDHLTAVEGSTSARKREDHVRN